MKFTIVPAFYNKPDYLQNLADSIKGHLEGYDYDHLCFTTGSRASHSQNRHYKITL
jgi:protoheme ferro-lyase